MSAIGSNPKNSLDSNHRQTSAAVEDEETSDCEESASRLLSREVASNSVDNRLLVNSDLENSLTNDTAVTDDDFSYYMQKKVSNSSHFKLFTFVEASDSVKSPYYSCHHNNNSTLINMESLPSHEIAFSFSVEYDKTNLTKDEMIEVVENEMTSTVANYLLNCGHNSPTQNDSTVSIARLRTSDATMEINGTEIVAVFSAPKDSLSGASPIVKLQSFLEYVALFINKRVLFSVVILFFDW
jgi:hypothetical protein